MVDRENPQKSSGGLHDGMCSACEMTVVWIQNQLRQNMTEDRIVNYVNEVGGLIPRSKIVKSLLSSYLC